MEDVIGISRDQAVAKRVNDAQEEVLDRCYTYHIFGDGRWGRSEDTCDFANALILGYLQRVDQTFLGDACIPYRCTIR